VVAGDGAFGTDNDFGITSTVGDDGRSPGDAFFSIRFPEILSRLFIKRQEVGRSIMGCQDNQLLFRLGEGISDAVITDKGPIIFHEGALPECFPGMRTGDDIPAFKKGIDALLVDGGCRSSAGDHGRSLFGLAGRVFFAPEQFSVRQPVGVDEAFFLLEPFDRGHEDTVFPDDRRRLSIAGHALLPADSLGGRPVQRQVRGGGNV